jgi:HEPN domain-containing protein
MSEPERLAAVGRWLRFAREDLSTAELIVEHGRPARQACFHAQQAAEKAIKAVLVFLQTEFPYRHDLDFLRTLLPDGWLLKENPPDLAELTAWAVRTRYPTGSREATEEDARTAVEQAREILDVALEDLKRYGYLPEETA